MIDMKDTVTYPLSSIMDEDEESRIDQLERELDEAKTKSKDREKYLANLVAANRILAREKIDAERELAEAKAQRDKAIAFLWECWKEARLVGVAAERERCAKVCEEFYSVENIAQKCAAAIRKGEIKDGNAD